MRRSSTVRLLVVLALAMPTVGAFAAAPAGADGGTSCTNDGGAGKFSPGLTADAQIQNIVAKGTLSGCDGGVVTNAKYVVHLKTDDAATCASLDAGTVTSTGTVVIKWRPKGTGNSKVSVTVAQTSPTTAHATGTVTKGLFSGSTLTADVSFTPVFKPKGDPCTAKNKLKNFTFTGTSPVVIA